jgi:hypothetical protein
MARCPNHLAHDIEPARERGIAERPGLLRIGKFGLRLGWRPRDGADRLFCEPCLDQGLIGNIALVGRDTAAATVPARVNRKRPD